MSSVNGWRSEVEWLRSGQAMEARPKELNRFFERTDDGVAQIDDHMVQAGTGVAMLPDDLHSIHIDGPALNFHCYGLALERLDAREYYNEAEGRWKIFRSVSGIREGRG